MHYLGTWDCGWHCFPLAMGIFMLLMMATCIFFFYRRRKFFPSGRWFRGNWDRDWFADCSRTRSKESAQEILKKRYVRGEITKEELEQMNRDITEVN